MTSVDDKPRSRETTEERRPAGRDDIFLAPDLGVKEAGAAEDTGDDTGDDGAWLAERHPARPGNAIVPLITAEQVYPALERSVLSARRTVHLGFRILDPSMRLVSEEARAEGLEDWGNLLVHAARRGVHVRFLLSDFDPIMAADLHRLTWRSYLRLREEAGSLDAEAHARLEMMASLHEAEAGSVMRTMFWPVVWRRLSGLAVALRGETRHTIGRAPHELTRSLREEENIVLRELPGVWQVVSRVMDLAPEEWAEQLERSAEHGTLSRLRAPLWPPAHLWPVTHHQKLALFDGTSMIVGGLDVNERRFDDPAHDRPAEEAWHDVSLQVEGPIVADAERHFAGLWNRERPSFVERREALRPLFGAGENLTAPTAIETVPDAADLEARGPTKAQFLRTVSRRREGMLAFSPRAVRRDLEAGHHAVIKTARRLLYIETQFFRLRSLSRAIAAQAKAHPELEVVILLPNAPEDVAWDDNDGPDATHGEYLQVRALNLLKRRLGDRLGLYMLLQRGREEDEEGRAKAFGTGIIYLHSKVIIADDRAALVSSANLNGRSFRWDTEAGVLFDQEGEAGPVRDLRRALWTAHMPNDSDPEWPLDEAAETWRRLSVADIDRPAVRRRNFVAPYQIGRARRFAKRSLFVPDDMI